MTQSAACINPPPRLPVRIRADLARFADDFLQKRRQELPTMRAAVQTNDFKALRTWGHNLSGTGSSFGFPPVTEMGRVLEQAAKTGNAAELHAGLENLARFLDNVEVVHG